MQISSALDLHDQTTFGCKQECQHGKALVTINRLERSRRVISLRIISTFNLNLSPRMLCLHSMVERPGRR